MHGERLAFVPGSVMKGSDPDALPPMGDKVVPVKSTVVPLEPAWRSMPAHPGYETDGDAVRRVPGS